MKKILVTGATGFIGANLVKALNSKNFEVHAIIRKSSNRWRIDTFKNIHIHELDILEYEKLKTLVEKISPEYIFHLATYGSYPKHHINEKKILETNIMGTYNLLKATLDVPYTRFINTGSSSEYGIKNTPMNESDIPNPNTFYGVTKASASLLCQHIAHHHKKPIITLRPFSVYGYYEESFRLIPYVIINCLKGQDIPLTKGSQRRDFVFIEDVIDAYLKAMEASSTLGEIFNVGYGKDISVKEVSLLIQNLIKSDNKLLFGQQKEQSFDTSTKWEADISSIKKKLNWEPKTSLAEGLKKTINWFKDNISLYEGSK